MQPDRVNELLTDYRAALAVAISYPRLAADLTQVAQTAQMKRNREQPQAGEPGLSPRREERQGHYAPLGSINPDWAMQKIYRADRLWEKTPASARPATGGGMGWTVGGGGDPAWLAGFSALNKAEKTAVAP